MHGSPRHVLSLFWLPLVGWLLFMAACTGTPQEKKAKHLDLPFWEKAEPLEC